MTPEKCEKKIVVLLSSYNGEKYIGTQLESILDQNTDTKVDIFIRDDGSTDGTIGILRRYAEKHDNISLTEGENVGFIRSFFSLIKNAPEADYYSLSDQDDKWLPNKLQCAIEALGQASQRYPGMPLLYGSTSFLAREDLKPFGETQKMGRRMTVYNTMIQNILRGHTQVFNTELCKIIRDMDLDYDRIYAHDHFLLNLAMIRGKVLFENKSHVLYRQNKSEVLGYGNGPVSWALMRLKRFRNGDGKKIARQIAYLAESEQYHLSLTERKEIKAFLNSRANLLTRFDYIRKTKLYRQERMQTVLFCLAYITGKYNE